MNHDAEHTPMKGSGRSQDWLNAKLDETRTVWKRWRRTYRRSLWDHGRFEGVLFMMPWVLLVDGIRRLFILGGYVTLHERLLSIPELLLVGPAIFIEYAYISRPVAPRTKDP